MSQESKKCGKCGKDLCIEHNCSSELEYTYCNKCDLYLPNNEYQDHVYCHSLEANSNSESNPNINNRFIHRNNNTNQNNRNNEPDSRTYYFSSNNNNFGTNSARNNNANPYFDSGIQF
jgi:hypothetical protein